MDKLTPHDMFTFLDATLYVGSTETKHNFSRKNQNKARKPPNRTWAKT